MLNVVVEIKAPEIVEAIKSLISTLVGARPAEVAPIQTPVIQQVPQVQEQPLQPTPELYQTQPQQTPLTIVPTTPQTYTLDQLAVAATQLIDAGRRAELLTLLAAFSVQALTMLPKEQYGNFATQLRAMGAKI